MNALDWILVVLVLLYAVSGYWQGFITGAFATAGLLLGGFAGVLLAPIALGNASPSLWVSLGALFIVILSASLGQALFQYVGARVRDRIRWQPVRALDAVGGAVLSAAAALLVAWALGVAVSGARIGPITKLVRDSAVLSEVNGVLPAAAADGLTSFNDVVGLGSFPRYLEPFAPERIINVAPGPARMLTDPDVVNAGKSVFKIYSTNRCDHGIEGSGFLYAPNRVMTNAHVVAGVSHPTVTIEGQVRDATVVYYNPDLDVAVLAVDSGAETPLNFTTGAKENDPVAILGYPEDGPYHVDSGRIRSSQRLRSPNIYGQGTVLREVYSVRGDVRPGNSGGPLVTSAGEVAGVVFAASVTDSQTGYALTAAQVERAGALGEAGSASVSTGGCAG